MHALIVEDEKTPRELLRDLVPWGKYGFTQVDTARNGLEALALLTTAPDLVVTDVRMPKMDGVELAIEIRRRWPQCVLIFLSGFSDKEYLKAAIRVQAQDYLDKPIDLAQVEASVARAAEACRQQYEAERETLRGEQALKEVSPLRRQAQAQALFVLGGTSTTIEERFLQGPLRALVLQSSAGPKWVAAVVAVINSDGFALPSLIAAPAGDVVAVACDRQLAADPTSFDRAVDSLLDLVTVIDTSAEIFLGVSAASNADPASMAAALREAREALAGAFYRPEQRVHTARPAPRSLELPGTVLESWAQALEQRDWTRVLGLIEQLKNQSAAIRDPDLNRVREVWLRAMDVIVGAVPSWGQSERRARLEKLGGEMAAARDLEALAASARDCFERLFVKPAGDLHSEDRVTKAKAFIETRFGDPDLSVDDIASRAGFSESYFCTVFKQTEGITVKDYVTRFRIERAKAYLWEQTPHTLADLALKVGFRDPNYFSTVFKRITGTSPGAYRKKALG
jgi:two-component system response regulator YesN